MKDRRKGSLVIHLQYKVQCLSLNCRKKLGKREILATNRDRVTIFAPTQQSHGPPIFQHGNRHV